MLMLLWTDHDTQFINVDQTNIIITTNMFIVLTIRNTRVKLICCQVAGSKENHFYSLPFGQAEASIY